VVSTYSRRALLGSLGGAASLGVVGYAGARLAAKRGTVVARYVGARTRPSGGMSETVDVYYAELNRDGTVDRRIHPDYTDRLPSDEPATVSRPLHQELTDRFESVRYNVNQSCPNASCSFPQVSRATFNGTRLGESVRFLYHSGVRATPVP
jgi:hypothetical protein